MAERKAVIGTVSMAAGNLLKLGLQFVYLPVLARLLDPASFGIVALAMPFILLASMISDAGLGNALIRHSSPSRELESTVFWISILLGVVLAAIVSLAAWPVAHWMAQPKLAAIMVALTAVLPICGALSVANARISRTQRFSLFAIGDLAATVISSCVAIAAAFAGMGPWSLVVQQFVFWTVKGVWLIPNSGFRPKLVFTPSLTLPDLGYGLNAAGSNLFDFATKNAPTMIIGGMLGVIVLGHYAMANQIIRVPDLLISGPIYLSVFTAVAQNDRSTMNQTALFLRGLRGLVTVLAPIFCGLSFAAQPVIQLLFGAKWAATAPILALLTPCGLLLCLYSFAGAIFMGVGRSDHQLKLSILLCVLLIGGTLFGAPYGGSGVALGLGVGATLAAPFYVETLARELHLSKSAIVKEVAPPLIATAAMALALSIVTRIDVSETWIHLSTMVVCGMVAYLTTLAAISWRRLEEDVQWLLSSKPDAGIEVP